MTANEPATGYDLDRASLPRMRISLLGAESSGKSSYVLGMFAALVRGQEQHQYSLSTANHDVGFAMLEEMDELCAGKPPRGTDEPKTHEFTLRGGLPGNGRTGGVQGGVVAIDLTDFRGGAIREKVVEDSDTARYYELLVESDSIFVVLDSSHFREPVTPSRMQAVAEATWAYRIGDRIGWAIGEREAHGLPAPSITVLLTKWDFLDDGEGVAVRGLGQVYADVKALLPRVFGVGLWQYVFTVSIGEFSDADGNPRQAPINLSGVEKPLFFATGCYLANVSEWLQGQRGRLEADRAAAAERLRKLTRWPEFIRQHVLRGWIEQRRDDLKAKNDKLAALNLRALNVSEHEKILRGLAS